MIEIIVGNGSRKVFGKLLSKHVFVNEKLERLDANMVGGTFVIETVLDDDHKFDLGNKLTKVRVKSGDCRYRDIVYYSAAHMEAEFREKIHDAEKGLSMLRGE